jgi:hypothetical protein
MAPPQSPPIVLKGKMIINALNSIHVRAFRAGHRMPYIRELYIDLTW